MIFFYLVELQEGICGVLDMTVDNFKDAIMKQKRV